jgi:hypothetical protein
MTASSVDLLAKRLPGCEAAALTAKKFEIEKRKILGH